MRTAISLILDESGSMESVRDTTISAVNEYLASLQRDNADEALFALTKFNTECTGEEPCPVADAKPLSPSTYVPSGATALYDAIAETVKATEQAQADRYLIIITTDGQENSSRETTKGQVMDLLKAKEALGNWTFVYLGANQDAWAVAAGLGVGSGNTVSYVATNQGVQHAVGAMASATKSYRASSRVQERSFSGSDSGASWVPEDHSIPFTTPPAPAVPTATTTTRGRTRRTWKWQ